MDEVRSGVVQQLPDLRRFARVLTRNPTAADDLVQECLTRALAKSHLYKPKTNLRAWLFTILCNLHASEMRRIDRKGHSVDPDDAAFELATSPDQERRMFVKALEKALLLLPGKQRELMILIALDAPSYEEAAEIFDVPVGTIKSRVCRGRQMLREILDGTPTMGMPQIEFSRYVHATALNGKQAFSSDSR